MPTPFPFSAGQVLQASQLNSISELPTRTLTSSGAAVAADAYSRVILNGTTISYTVNSATFSAGQIVQIYNANSTVATIAAGTGGVTINSAAGLTLQQWQAATLYAVSATSFVLFDSAVTPGLELVKTQTIGTTVSSVTVTNAFSATYDNYRIVINGGTGSTSGALRLQFGNAATAYYWATFEFTYAGVNNSGALANTSSVTLFSFGADGFAGWADVFNPFATRRTSYSSAGAQISTTGGVNFIAGYLNNTTSYTDFTLLTSTGTLTGGEIRVYGYRNS